MMRTMPSTKNLQRLWEQTRKDHLRMRIYLHNDSTDTIAIFVLAVHTKHQQASLIEVKTKNLESAAALILDKYNQVRP